MTQTQAESPARLKKEAGRRRTFAIISHPDAGKTTLTEKLLLYGGAIHLAGSVKARRAARHATSDWMKMEQERGISVTSSVLHFDYAGFRLNLLDTPGHQDFSEDTYRALVAADSAVMLLDNRKGVEEQTRKLFAVCRRRRLPIFTFVNKCDRAGEDPLQLLDDVERDLDIKCYPVTWPIRDGTRFLGVLDRASGKVHLFEKGADHGQSRTEAQIVDANDPVLLDLLPSGALETMEEEVALLDAVGATMDEAAVRSGELSLTFFGSALTNFGVEPFIKHFLAHAPPPASRETSTHEIIQPTDPEFSGLVFKIQANMDPKHRGQVAFVRIVSGRYEPGMTVNIPRTDQRLRLAAPQQLMARERVSLEEAWPGDVVGVVDRGSLRVGDSLSTQPGVEFTGMPRFSPEHFASVKMEDAMKRKHLDRGLRQLAEEGTIQLLYAESLTGPIPIVGAVGMLQFDVLLARLDAEYGVTARLEPLPYRVARWVVGPEARMRAVGTAIGRKLVEDAGGKPMVLFETEWSLQRAAEGEKELRFHDVRP
ncbi:MAG: peptide chain release factor 3 [Gemmatimonadota bacterium]